LVRLGRHSHPRVAHEGSPEVQGKDVNRDPRVALSILDPDNPYRYIEIRGFVAEVQDDPEKTLIHALAKKYQGLDSYPYDGPGDERVIFKIAPERVVAHG
jgi:PPOX class probable F420-dependent enzyme